MVADGRSQAAILLKSNDGPFMKWWFCEDHGSERGHLKVHKSPSESFAIFDLKLNPPYVTEVFP